MATKDAAKQKLAREKAAAIAKAEATRAILSNLADAYAAEQAAATLYVQAFTELCAAGDLADESGIKPTLVSSALLEAEKKLLQQQIGAKDIELAALRLELEKAKENLDHEKDWGDGLVPLVENLLTEANKIQAPTPALEDAAKAVDDYLNP